MCALFLAVAERDSPEVRRRGLVALTDGVAFCESNFKNPDEAQFIMSTVAGVLEDPSEEHQVLALQILVEIARCYYDNLTQFLQPLQAVTFHLAREGSDQVAAQAIEFWSTVCEGERARTLEGRGNQ